MPEKTSAAYVSSLLEARISYLQNTPQTSPTVRTRCWQQTQTMHTLDSLCERVSGANTSAEVENLNSSREKKKVLCFVFLPWKHVVFHFFCSVGLIGIIWGARKHSLLIKTLAFTLILPSPKWNLTFAWACNSWHSVPLGAFVIFKTQPYVS